MPNETSPRPTLPGLFDSHAHYDSRAFRDDRDALLAALPSQGVSLVLLPGSDVARSTLCAELATRHKNAYAAVGIHPQEAARCLPSYLARLRELASQEKVVAIGEIGLDYYYDEGVPHPVQQAIFRAQMELARECQLPVIIHDRDAHEDTLRIVRDYPEVRGVFHCYAGSAEQAKILVQLGYYISFTGTITFKNARRGPEVIAAVPLERLLIETDAPYMAPTPFRGQRCDSTMVYRMAETIAEIRGLPTAEVARITTENGKRLFGITEETSK